MVAVLAAAGCDGEDACERAARRIDSDCSGDPYGDAFATTRAQFVTSCRVGDAECGQCVEDVLGAAAGGSCVDRLEACRSACASTTADGGIDTDARALEDAGPGADAGGGDSGSDGAVDTCDTSTPGVGLGSACSAGMCGEPWECQAEMAAVEIPTTTPTGEPGPALIATIYPDGLCSTTCLLDDPGEVCGECGRCDGIRLGRIFLITGVDPAGNALGVCRASCLPSRTDNGGCREGYTCDVNNGTCVEACESDMQCQFGSGDGGQIVFIGAESGARCDPATARCTVSGDDGARPGDACTRDTDCEDDGFCITGDEWPGGYCSRAGCLFDGFECAEGAACDVRSFGSVSVCLDGCRVGAEPLADVLGADGNGAGCAEGFMCSWDGRSGPSSDPNGGCQPGAYNDVTTPNLAQPCQSDADCYSPYGYARCLFEDSTDVISGMCSLRSCAQFDEGGAIVSGILPGSPRAFRSATSRRASSA
ncbi:MAG: hypothetical protein M5U28_45765 [Sandaracinaceae bacterium]|nr:hypothetical protein [Sandaracinaceae bacterium]